MPYVNYFLKNGIAVKFWKMSKKLGFSIAAQLKILGKKEVCGDNGGGGIRSMVLIGPDGPN